MAARSSITRSLHDGLMPHARELQAARAAVGDKTHEGPSSNDVIIRNNIANGLCIYNVDPNMTMDHNICLALRGNVTILTYVNGKPKWGVVQARRIQRPQHHREARRRRHVCQF